MPAAGRLRDMTGGNDVFDQYEVDEGVVEIEGLVEVDHYMRRDAIKPGILYRCWSNGGLSFNLADAQATEGTVANANGASLIVNPSQAYNRFVSGDEVTIGARTLGDLTQGNTYYVERGNTGNNEMFLHTSRQNALLGRSSTRVSSNNNGIISGTPPTINLAAGPRDQGKFGSNAEDPILIYEATDAYAYQSDNYNDDSKPSRLQAGAITFENMIWRSTLPNQDRSDFDIAPAARPTFINCRLSCLQQYSHFASPHMTWRDSIFDSNFYSTDQGQRVLDIAAKIPVPEGFTLQPRGNDLRVLGVFLDDVTETNPLANFLRLDNLSGIRNLEVSTFNPNGASLTPTQIALKGVALYNPAGVIGRTNGNGSQFIFRSIHFDTGGETIHDTTQTIVDPTQAGHLDPTTKTGTGNSSLDFSLISHGAVSTQTYTEFDSYEAIHTSPLYRKRRLAFTIDKSPSVAGHVQNIGMELVREQYPNGVNFALKASPPTEAESLEDIYDLYKRFEVSNPTAFSRNESIALIQEGYIKFADNVSVVLDSQATDAFAFDDSTDTVTIKAEGVLATGSNDLLGIEVGGTGTITPGLNQTLPRGILYRTKTGGNAVLNLTGLDTQAKTALFTSTGALVGSVITGTATSTIEISQDEAGTGMVLASYRRGYIEQLLPLDLSAGGAYTRNLEPMFEIRDFDDRGVFYSDRLSTLSDFVFGQENVPGSDPVTQRPSCVIRVGNEQWQLRSLSSTYFNALWSEDGLRYLARGGRQINFFSYSSYLGAEFSLPPGTKITRRAPGDTSATILSTIYVRSGEQLFVSSDANASVQLNGIKSQDEFATAIWGGRVDIANAPAGSALASFRIVKAVLAGAADINGSTYTFRDDNGTAALTATVSHTGRVLG